MEGTWSASLEWLVRRLAPRFRHLLFAEVRYRVKSWRQLEACIEGALHGIALRAHWGRPVPLLRAGAWERLVAAQLTAL